MTDRDESGLHATQLGLEGSALLTSEDLVLGDLRDAAFIDDLVAASKPDIIFHAAALKHLTFLERFPEQAVRTNVGASLDLLDAAVANDVGSFVHISTDKAAGATSVLGTDEVLDRTRRRLGGGEDRSEVHVRAFRQCARFPRFGAGDLRRAGGGRRSGHGHRPGSHPLLHDGR